jgi:hypothetical protein
MSQTASSGSGGGADFGDDDDGNNSDGESSTSSSSSSSFGADTRTTAAAARAAAAASNLTAQLYSLLRRRNAAGECALDVAIEVRMDPGESKTKLIAWLVDNQADVTEEALDLIDEEIDEVGGPVVLKVWFGGV